MLRIRLSRVGKKKQPSYRIVVADSRAPRDGAFLKIIGHYDPLAEPVTLVVKEDEAVHWLKQGALPSETAAKLLTRLGVMEKAGKEPLVYKGPEVPAGKRPKKGEAAAPASAAAPAAAAPAAAAPAAAVAEAPAAAPEAAAEPAPEPEAAAAEPEPAAEAAPAAEPEPAAEAEPAAEPEPAAEAEPEPAAEEPAEASE